VKFSWRLLSLRTDVATLQGNEPKKNFFDLNITDTTKTSRTGPPKSFQTGIAASRSWDTAKIAIKK
jgi:hypothetical protein